MTKQTHDVYLLNKHNVHAVGFNPSLEKEIKETLQRIEDNTYEYVGEVKLKVKSEHWEVHDGH